MACADVEMDIQCDEELPRPGRREPPPIPSLVQCYQAQEMLPDEKGPLHKLMEKEPAVLGVRIYTIGNNNDRNIFRVNATVSIADVPN